MSAKLPKQPKLNAEGKSVTDAFVAKYDVENLEANGSCATDNQSSAIYSNMSFRQRTKDYVLLHGADEFESGWSPRDIAPQQATDILSLLKEHYENKTGLELFRELRKQISAG